MVIVVNVHAMTAMTIYGHNLWEDPYCLRQRCNLHLGDEGAALAHDLAQHPGVLLPVDGEVVRQACNEPINEI